MTVSDTLHYLLIGNPVCKSIIGATSGMLGSTFKSIKVHNNYYFSGQVAVSFLKILRHCIPFPPPLWFKIILLDLVNEHFQGNGHNSMSAGKVISETAPSVPRNLNLWKMAGSNHNFIRLAGLSGATAILLAAYGGHRLQVPEKAEYKNSFDIANRFHFFCSLALMGIPMAKYPKLVNNKQLPYNFLMKLIDLYVFDAIDRAAV